MEFQIQHSGSLLKENKYVINISITLHLPQRQQISVGPLFTQMFLYKYKNLSKTY